LSKLPRLIAIDTLRTIAILTILIWHAKDYLRYIPSIIRDSPLILLGPIYSEYFSLIGLGIFVFISGYSLYYNNNQFSDLSNFIDFYLKRFVSIYPLYWIAIAAFLVTLNPVNNIGVKIIHVFGLQVLLAPKFVTPMLTLWFIGLISILYIVYPIIICYSHSTKDILLIGSAIFIVLYLLHVLLNIMDNRLFDFGPFFVGGIIACRQRIYLQKYKLGVIVVALISVFILACTGFTWAIHIVVVISLCILLIYLCDSYTTHGYTRKICIILATASYCIYLFHRPYFWVLISALNAYHASGLYFDLLFLILGWLPLLYFSYHLQIYFDNMIKTRLKVRGRKNVSNGKY
jgi:peptidoglycan/LPS O-acetylase OafA/YrhL